MLKRYKNEILAAVQGQGFNPVDFTPIEAGVDGLPAFILRYKNSDLQFIIRNNKDDPHEFDYTYTPFFPGRSAKYVDYCPDEQFAGFPFILTALGKWLSSHVHECISEESIPDLWEAVRDGAFLSDSGDKDRETPEFSEQEKVQIKVALVSFERAVIDAFKPSQDQVSALRLQIQYLSEAVSRLNRFDWKSVALSTLIGVCTSLSLDTEKGRHLYGLFQQAMTTVTHLLK